jgi:hypothetical protein
MKVMSKVTSLSNEEVMDKAKEFFDGRLGLKLRDIEPKCCVEFSSNLGFVTIKTSDEGHDIEVTVSTREYEYQIQEFLKTI